MSLMCDNKQEAKNKQETNTIDLSPAIRNPILKPSLKKICKLQPIELQNQILSQTEMSQRFNETNGEPGQGTSNDESNQNQPPPSKILKSAALDHRSNLTPVLGTKRRRTDIDNGSYELLAQLYHRSTDQAHNKDFSSFDDKKQSLAIKQQHLSLKSQLVDSTKHLIRSILDLPVFVTIEGHRVASYSIDGEPHLCLPQLIQFIQKSFPLDKVIDKFEESVTNFVQATPKQLEGFKKAMVLPHDVAVCSMVKRSDAEWICLALYDQHAKDKWGDIVDLCSKNDLKDAKKSSNSDGDEQHEEGDEAEEEEEETSHASGELTSPQKEDGNGQSVEDTEDKDKCDLASPMKRLSDGISRSSSSMSSHVLLDLASGKSNLLREQQNQQHQHQNRQQLHEQQTNERPQSSLEDDVEAATRRTSSTDLGGTSSSQLESSSSIIDKQKLFNSETQGAILTLAKEVTSTLMIQVYHRCFGKCVGLYYPTLLRESKSDCIECSSCHKMLSPRRFIGHTHGTKETNVCHWGFNSYHWRDYIRLSRKQSMNNLDDDELVLQFNFLKSMSDEEADYGISSVREQITKSPDRASVDDLDAQPQAKAARSHSRRYASNSSVTLTRHNPSTNHSTPRASTSREAIDGLAKLPSVDTNRLLLADSANISRFADMRNPLENPYLWLNMDQTLATPAHNTSLPANLAQVGSPNIGEGTHSRSYPDILPYGPSTSSNMRALAPNYQSAPIDQKVSSSLQFNMANFLSEFTANVTNFSQAPQVAASNISSFLQPTPERMARQDVFVSASMRSYLFEKGLPSSMIDEMVDTTLAFINRARILF